jgi:CheY-like chemotaxis protein
MPTGRVLIVDDDRANALDLQQRVTQLGYTVLAIAASGQEALAQAAAGRPDVVVMELRLRGLVDGIQAGTLIWVQFGIPVIYVSAQVTAPTFQRLWPTAPVGLLGKHVGRRDLGKAVEDVLGRRVPTPVEPAGRRQWPPLAAS